MTKYLTLLLFIGLAWGQDITVAVFEFENNGLEDSEIKILTDELQSQLIQIGGYKLVERRKIDNILKEQKYQLSGCVDECMIEVGVTLGAKQIITGNIGRLGKKYTVIVNLVDVSSGEFLNSSSYSTGGDVSLLLEGMTQIAYELIGVKNIETNLSDLAPARSNSQEKININYNPSFTPTYTAAEYKSAYIKALQKFQNQEFDEAINIFRNLIQSNIVTDLTDNSQYWIAECYYSKKEFKRAIAEFEKVFTYPGTDKDDDAQLKIGLAYQSIGNIDKAREEFQRFMDYFPGSEYYPKAKEAIKQLSIN
tara:strand:- start:443 stop:1366 length:924 start_codon:yes stop_codon:yes gene_type:complete